MQYNIKPNEHVGLLGRTQSGKSHFCREVLLTYFRRLIVIDTEEKGEFPESAGFQQMNYKLINPANKDLIAILRGYPKTKDGRSPAFRWNIPFPVGQEGEQRLEVLCAILLRYGSDMAIYIDEAGDFVNAHYMPEQFNALMRKSAKRGINVIWTTQRMPNVNGDMAGNTVHLFVFNIEPSDAIALKKKGIGWIADNLNQIPFGSHRALYHSPSGEIQIVQAPNKVEVKPNVSNIK
ncbi:MAG: hypothetical protein WA549_06015 [Thermoplasmata archaeon]